jgi:hypothetical protein
MPNLIRQRRASIRRGQRRMGKSMESMKWYIGKRVNRKTFYVAEHDSNENTTMWTPNRREAISFAIEAAAHKFIARYLHDRTDVILVNVTKIT